eukprot:5475314-Amphidinium_carterae.1
MVAVAELRVQPLADSLLALHWQSEHSGTIQLLGGFSSDHIRYLRDNVLGLDLWKSSALSPPPAGAQKGCFAVVCLAKTDKILNWDFPAINNCTTFELL